MATIVFAAEMRQLAGGLDEFSIEAASYRAALRELTREFPRLDEAVFKKFAVAIDGVLIQSPLLEALEPDSELVFIPKIAAG